MIAQISQVATKYTSIEHLVNAFEYVNASKTAENGTENSCRYFDGFVGRKLGSFKYSSMCSLCSICSFLLLQNVHGVGFYSSANRDNT